MFDSIAGQLVALEQLHDYGKFIKVLINTIQSELKHLPECTVMIYSYNHSDVAHPAVFISSESLLHNYIEPIKALFRKIQFNVTIIDVYENNLVIGFETHWFQILKKLQSELEKEIKEIDSRFGIVAVDWNEGVVAINYNQDENVSTEDAQNLVNKLGEQGYPLVEVLQVENGQAVFSYNYLDIGMMLKLTGIIAHDKNGKE